jgi:hypothetical protein
MCSEEIKVIQLDCNNVSILDNGTMLDIPLALSFNFKSYALNTHIITRNVPLLISANDTNFIFIDVLYGEILIKFDDTKDFNVNNELKHFTSIPQSHTNSLIFNDNLEENDIIHIGTKEFICGIDFALSSTKTDTINNLIAVLELEYSTLEFTLDEDEITLRIELSTNNYANSILEFSIITDMDVSFFSPKFIFEKFANTNNISVSSKFLNVGNMKGNINITSLVEESKFKILLADE